MRKSIKESDYIFQFDEFLSLMKKEDVTVKIAKNGYVFFADDETLGNNLLGFINPNTSNQKLYIKVPVSTVATLDEFEDTKELVDFIISEYSHYKRKFESKKSVRKSIKENKMILSFEAFKDICVEEIGYSYIGSFDEYKGTYFVSVIDDKRADKFCKYLRNNHDCECTFWKITDPYDDDYGLYRVEVI